MRACALPLLALAPCMTMDHPAHPEPAMAIELHVRAPLGDGAFEWEMRMGAPPAPSTPYDLRFCSDGTAADCGGVQVTVRVLVGPREGTAG
jgi:hypothetical protein